MPTADELTDAELSATVTAVLDRLARETVRIEIHLGAAHDTYPAPVDEMPALAVLDDPDVIASMVAGFASVDVTRRVVAQALPGLRIRFCDDEGDSVGFVDLPSLSWVRGPWPYDGLLASPVLTDVLDRLGAHVWPERAVEDHLLDAMSTASLEARARVMLSDVRRTGIEPGAGSLRAPRDRWVRFHSLPGSKRYADDEGEYGEILRRHRMVLDELAAFDGAPDSEVLVVTSSWSGTPIPVPLDVRVAAALPASQYWMSELTQEPDDDDAGYWTHRFFDVVDRNDPRMDQLLRLVADDVTAGVLICDAQFRWLYHPYDGGADVYPATVEQRDELRDRHADWLSRHPSGR